jgi:hypothetical protein
MNRELAIKALAAAVNNAVLPLEDYIVLAPRVKEDGKLSFGDYSMTVEDVLDVECTEAF